MDAGNIIGQIFKLVFKAFLILIWIPTAVIMVISFFLTYHFHEKWINWTKEVWDKK